MGSNKQQRILQEGGRWLRVGALSFTALSPFLSWLANRLRAQAEADKAQIQPTVAKKSTEAEIQALQEDLQFRLQSIGANLSEILEDLRERGSKLGQDFTNRSSDISQELLQSAKKAQMEKTQQKRNFWLAFGFGLGLTAAGITTYVLLKKRLQQQAITQQEQEQEEPSIQLPNATPVAASVPLTRARGDIYEVKPTLTEDSDQSSAQKPSAIRETVEDSQPSAPKPTDAAFIGIPSTRRYYPVETPLDKLTSSDNSSERKADVIYFATEKEAQLQGFSAAEV